MANRELFDLTGIDLQKVQFDAAAIEAVNPHRGCMRLLDGVIYENAEQTQAVAYKDVRADEFWVPGHVPGRPLYPGVLMVESAAQLASFVTLRRLGADFPFMGFVGADDIKFRMQVTPGTRLLLLALQVEFRKRRSVCRTQGWINGALAFEATITGMIM
ncbi:MAG: beta-hydroxyacyl-ACP dehydratase [Phycisphaeraceae bacterium]|nr:beta-hydroxyacyl-ACP dehydratase [Phycisphaeraceae bacterium]